MEKKQKIIGEIDLIIRNSESSTDFDELLHSEKTKKKYEWYEHDLMTYIDDLKYDQFVNDMDLHFSHAKVTNFDTIHHQCCSDKLEIQNNITKLFIIKIL